MARLPVLEHAFGQDRLAVLHRLVGFTSFNLMLAHVVLITWGYAAGDLLATPVTAWNLTLDYPGMLLAVAGTACLVMVVVTSVRAARRRLRYESWHLLHLYAYLGVGLALPHQLWTGQELMASTAATVYWWGVWALAAGAVLVWRVGLPVWRNARHRLRVTSVVHEADGIVSRLRDRAPAGPAAGRGRAVLQLAVPGPGRLDPRQPVLPVGGARRPQPADHRQGPRRRQRRDLRTCGPAPGCSSRGRTGGSAPAPGPGAGRARRRRGRRDAAAGAGRGPRLRPRRRGAAAALQRASRSSRASSPCCAASAACGVLFLPGRRRAPDSWLGDGDRARVDDLAALRHWVPDIAERDVYVCGPEPWVDSVRRTTAAAGVPADRFHVETFGW